jgi:hypothetical protein
VKRGKDSPVLATVPVRCPHCAYGPQEAQIYELPIDGTVGAHLTCTHCHRASTVEATITMTS